MLPEARCSGITPAREPGPASHPHQSDGHCPSAPESGGIGREREAAASPSTWPAERGSGGEPKPRRGGEFRKRQEGGLRAASQ